MIVIIYKKQFHGLGLQKYIVINYSMHLKKNRKKNLHESENELHQKNRFLNYTMAHTCSISSGKNLMAKNKRIA
jgi:hypothetical protein